MSEPVNNDMILGEIRGKLSEVAHSVAGLSQNIVALSREVGGLGALATDIATVKLEVAALKGKVDVLEAERNQRTGANGMWALLLRSPALGWLVGAAITAWAILTGRVHI